MSGRFVLWLIAVAAPSKARAVWNQLVGTFADLISSSCRMVTEKYNGKYVEGGVHCLI